MNKISIITINYNDYIGLEKTIESVINQSYKNIEYIVIDGGSTDESLKIIEKSKNQISYFVSEPDAGVYNAMNKGIKVATGEYLIFMNSGDYFYNTTTLTQIIPHLDSVTDIVYGDAIFFNNSSQKIVSFPKKLGFSFFYVDSLCHQATFIHKKLFLLEKYNENFKIISDWEFNVKNICLNNKSYKHVHQTICFYDTNGISSTEKKLDKTERNLVYQKYFALYIDDYEQLQILRDKRIKSMIYIKKFNIPWKILKGFSKILLLFLPKQP